MPNSSISFLFRHPNHGDKRWGEIDDYIPGESSGTTVDDLIVDGYIAGRTKIRFPTRADVTSTRTYWR